MVSRAIATILLLLWLFVGCAPTEHSAEQPAGPTTAEAQPSEPETPQLPDLTLEEAYLEGTEVPITLNLVDDDSMYAGVVWRDATGEWNAIYEGLPLWHSVADHRYEDGELVVVLHTWGERADGTRTPTLVSEVRYTEAEFIDDLRVTDDGEVFVLANVVPRSVGQLEEEP